MSPPNNSRKFNWLVFGVVFAGGIGAALVYAFNQPRLYQSSAKFQFWHNSTFQEFHDFREMVAMIRLPAVTRQVTDRLMKSEDLQAFLKPYDHASSADVATVEKILLKNRRVVTYPEAEIGELIYQHPDRIVASRIANLFVQECSAFGHRRGIDRRMEGVERLKIQAEGQQRKTDALEQSLASYRAAHLTASPETLQTDKAYQALSLQLATEQKSLQEQITLIRGMTMRCGPYDPAYRALDSFPAEGGDYLLSPIIQTLGWGFMGATILGVMSGFAFKRSAGCGALDRGYMGIFRTRFMGPFRSIDVIVFVSVFLAGFSLVVYAGFQQSRAYQSSITLAATKSPAVQGPGDDLPALLPVITLRVAKSYGEEYAFGESQALLKSYGLGKGADLSAITAVLRRNQRAVFHADTGTMELYYRHPDPELANKVIRDLGRAYEDADDRRNVDKNRATSHVRVIKHSGLTVTNDYLTPPIIANLGLGLGGASMAGLLSVLVLRMVTLLTSRART